MNVVTHVAAAFLLVLHVIMDSWRQETWTLCWILNVELKICVLFAPRQSREQGSDVVLRSPRHQLLSTGMPTGSGRVGSPVFLACDTLYTIHPVMWPVDRRLRTETAVVPERFRSLQYCWCFGAAYGLQSSPTAKSPLEGR